MVIDGRTELRDHSTDALAFWLARRRDQLRPLVTQRLLAEYVQDPDGKRHSADLMRVLNFVRSLAGDRKEFIFEDRDAGTFQIGNVKGAGQKADLTAAERYATAQDAAYAVLLQRLAVFGLDLNNLPAE